MSSQPPCALRSGPHPRALRRTDAGEFAGRTGKLQLSTTRVSIDHKSDDNADDSCAPNYGYDTAFRLLNGLFSNPAHFWQCGGQGFESP
jgi:hypothetical protein